MVSTEINYKALIEAAPDLYLILDPSLKIIAVSDAYLKATLINRNDVLGCYIFDVFPDNPNDQSATGVNNLRYSLEYVLATKTKDIMAVQKYDIRTDCFSDNGEFEVRYWSPINIPIFGENEEIQYIIHRVEDVTEFIKLKETKTEKNEVKKLREHALVMEKEIYQRAQEIQSINKELRIANDELAKKREEQEYLYNKLQNLLQLKMELFANVSHEFRTPLTLIIGLLEKILAKYTLHPDMEHDFKLVEKNAFILQKYVNDLLDIAKSEAGKMALKYEVVDMAELVRTTADYFSSLAKEHSIAYYIDSPDSIIMQTDPEKLQRILLNLLSNAFKFTPDGGMVTCRLYVKNRKAVLIVSDNGPGIPQALKKCVFERFYQGEKSIIAPQFFGTGLGLAIAKDFTECLGGQIIITDAPKGGAIFTIEIPIRVLESKEIQTSSVQYKSLNKNIEDTHKKTIMFEFESASDVTQPFVTKTTGKPSVLLVEDNPDLQYFIAETLSSYFDVIIAKDGYDGLQKIILYKPDLVLSDIMMPNMNGETLVYEIRKKPELNDIPIILITANSDEQLRLKLLKKGVQDYLSKPFSQEELIARISNMINLRRAKCEIEQKNNELTIMNEELDAFSRTVSHDLRNPVNAILGFSSLLLKNVGLNQIELDYLNEIHCAAKRMEQLIQDLLTLSKTSCCKLHVESINLSAMVTSIITSLQKSNPNRTVKCIVQSDIFVFGDPNLLQISLENLINNAWKYTSKNAHALIEFGVIDEINSPVYFIRDNGVGFSQADVDKLFIPFSRLHSETEFTGTGLGLVTIKRIIARHGGQVWAESSSNKQTTFYITLPDSTTLSQERSSESMEFFVNDSALQSERIEATI